MFDIIPVVAVKDDSIDIPTMVEQRRNILRTLQVDIGWRTDLRLQDAGPSFALPKSVVKCNVFSFVLL